MRYEYEREETGAGTKLTYLLIGGGIGAILALLFAPKSGEELRGDIADATRKGIEKGRETAALVGERAGEYYEVSRERAGELYSSAQERAGELRDKASDLYSTAQEKVGELKDRASSLTEKAKEAAAGSNPLSDAIEAGNEAYAEEKRRLEDKAPTASDSRPFGSEEKVLELPKDTSEA